MITLESLSGIVENAINNYYYKEGRYDMVCEIANELINSENDTDALTKIKAILFFELENARKEKTKNGTK